MSERRTKAFIAKAQSLGAALLYAPVPGGTQLNNLGSVSLSPGQLLNGAALSSPGLFDEAPDVVLDGVNDYVETGWKTRTNLIVNPLVATLSKWASQSGAGDKVTLTTEALPARLGGGVGNVVRCEITESSSGHGLRTESVPVTASTRKDAGIFLKMPAGKKLEFVFTERTAEDVNLGTSGTVVVGTGAWQWVAINRTFGATGVKARLIVWSVAGAEPFAFTAVGGIIEEGRTTQIAEEEYFPTAAQLTEGLAGWSSVTAQSASDIGPFARGTKRTFVAAFQQQELKSFMGLFGPQSGTGNRSGAFISAAGSVTFRLADGTTVSDKTAAEVVKTVSVAHIVAFAWDGVANTLNTYVDGAKKLTTATTATHVDSGVPFTVGYFPGSPFKGQILPFAVFPSALNEEQVGELTRLLEGKFPDLPAASVLSEPVDDTLFVKLTTAEGNNNRLSGIEDEASKIATGITTSNTAPGGHQSANLTLLRDPRLSFSDLNYIDDLVIYGRVKPLGRNVFEGMTEQFPSQLADTSSIAINAVGNQALLSENEAWKALYVDLGFGNWQEARLARKKQLSEAGYPQGKISLSSGEDGLVWTVPAGQALGAAEITEAIYRAAVGCPVGAVAYKGTRVKNWASFEAPTVFFPDDELFLLPYASAGLTLDGTARVVNIAQSSGKAWKYVLLRAEVTSSSVVPEAGTLQTYSALAVYGSTGVPLQTIEGQLPGVYGHDVLAHIVSTGAPDLNYTIGGAGSIVPNTSFVMPNFAPTEGGKPSDAIEKLNAYFLNNWGVFDDKEFFWKPWNPEDLNWQISITGGAQWTPVGRQATTLLNGLVVSYTDSEGVSRFAGPPGSGCDYESPLLVNPDPTNPYTRKGRRRWGTLNVGFQLAYPTTAFQVGSIVLAESMMPQRSGSLTIRPRGAGHIPSVTHPTMGQLPVWALRAGDYATLMDWPVPEALRVTEVSYTHDTKTLTAQLDSGAARLTAILERTGSSLTV